MFGQSNIQRGIVKRQIIDIAVQRLSVFVSADAERYLVHKVVLPVQYVTADQPVAGIHAEFAFGSVAGEQHIGPAAGRNGHFSMYIILIVDYKTEPVLIDTHRDKSHIHKSTIHFVIELEIYRQSEIFEVFSEIYVTASQTFILRSLRIGVFFLSHLEHAVFDQFRRKTVFLRPVFIKIILKNLAACRRLVKFYPGKNCIVAEPAGAEFPGRIRIFHQWLFVFEQICQYDFILPGGSCPALLCFLFFVVIGYMAEIYCNDHEQDRRDHRADKPHNIFSQRYFF